MCRAAALEREQLIAFLLLSLAIAFNLIHLYPEIAVDVPDLNDGVLHRVALDCVATSLTQGQNPTDPWLAPFTMGYPLFHYYQPLAYIPPATLHALSFRQLPLTDLFNWTRYLLLSLFPLSIFWSMRRFDFGTLPASLCGLVAPLLATNGLFGFEYGSYVWGGLGMYTQLWGMFLLPIALARCYVTLRDGRGYFWATLLLAATLLSHLVLGYIALASVLLLTLAGAVGPLARATVWQRGKRLLLLLTSVAIVTAYFWVPFFLDRAYFNRSVWEAAERYDSFGHRAVLGALVRGELFDFARWPMLTLLVAAGSGLCLWRWREERFRIPLALFAAWLLLYFGRPTWGVLLDLLPMSHDLRLNRLIAGVHLGGIFLAGLGLSIPWRWALARRDHRYLVVPSVLTALLLIPVYHERRAYLQQNATWMRDNHAAYTAETDDFEALLETLSELPPGRVYAGRLNNWGSTYKVGDLPVYAILNGRGLDMLGKLYHALSLNADIQVLFDHSRVDHYNLFNVRYLVVPTDWPVTEFFEAAQEFGRHRLYRAVTTGYFDLVASDLAFAGDKNDFYQAASHWLASSMPVAKQHPVVYLDGFEDLDPQPLPLTRAVEAIDRLSLPAARSPGRIISETVGNDAYETEVELERDATLMLKVTYHPNWRATLDGSPARTMMLMPSYIGVKVPAGTHRIRLAYRPRLLKTVLLILGLVALGLIAVVERRKVVRKLLSARGQLSG